MTQDSKTNPAQDVSDAKNELWRIWAIDGMPKDKQRLAEAAFEIGLMAGLGQSVARELQQAQVVGEVVEVAGGLSYSQQREVIEYITTELYVAKQLIDKALARAEAIDCQPIATPKSSAPVVGVTKLREWQHTLRKAMRYGIDQAHRCEIRVACEAVEQSIESALAGRGS